MKILDIKYSKSYGTLSNFAEHPFIFRDMEIASMEGLLQGLKIRDPIQQRALFKLTGYEAKEKGSTDWQNTGILYWQGEPVCRYRREYRKLLREAYDALSQNEEFAEALLETRFCILTHTIGRGKSKRQTVLTENEFLHQLYRCRRKLGRKKMYEKGKKYGRKICSVRFGILWSEEK